MPHQCVHCGKFYPSASKALLEGCDSCGSHFFFYVREGQAEKAKEKQSILKPEEKKQVEKDIRDMAGIKNDDYPVILDIESVRSLGTGKFEIDLVNLFNKDKPIVYKIEEGKYMIDLSSKLKMGEDFLSKK